MSTYVVETIDGMVCPVVAFYDENGLDTDNPELTRSFAFKLPDGSVCIIPFTGREVHTVQ